MELPMPDDWNGEDFCKWAICWPDSVKWKSILYGLIESPNQGRFWDFSTGNFLLLRQSFKPAYDYNFELKGSLMSCQDTGIADALNAIAVALSGNQGATVVNVNSCCEEVILSQGGGYQGSLTQGSGETIPIYGTEPLLSVEGGQFPDGYKDLEEYQLDKCQVANLIIDGVTGTLQGLGALGVFNAIATAGLVVAAVAGAIVFPPAFIPIALAAIGALAVDITILAVVRQEILDNREDWVCAIYEADGVEAAISALADLIDLLLAAIPITGTIGVAVKTLLLVLLNGDTLNQAFEKTAHLLYPDADCGGCGGCQSVQIQYGERITGDDDIGSYVSEFVSEAGNHYLTLWFDMPAFNFDEGSCGLGWSVDVSGVSGVTGVPGFSIYRCYADNGDQVYGDDVWGTPVCCSVLVILSSTAFSATIERVESC